MSPVLETRKVTVETILEYVTKGHIAAYTILFLNLKWFYSLVPFSTLTVF